MGETSTGAIDEEYLLLLRAGCKSAHAANPDCSVLNEALADVFLVEDELYLATALERVYDPDGNGDANDDTCPFFGMLNIHTYQTGTADAAWYEERLPATLRVMERFGDRDKPIWLTETGYGPVTTPLEKASFVDEGTQADTVRLIYQATSTYPQVERVFWSSLHKYCNDASATNTAMGSHCSLLRATSEPNPAYLAYGQLTGGVDSVLNLVSVTHSKGTAQVMVPSSFVIRSGAFVVFGTLERVAPTGVLTYEASPANGEQD